MALFAFLRPDDGNFNFMWNYYGLCHFIGRFFCLHTCLHPMLLTLFGYFKSRLYFRLSQSSRLKNLKRAIECSIIFSFFVSVAIVGICDSGPHEIHGLKSCAVTSEYMFMMYSIGGILFFSINGGLIIIFYEFRNLEHESIPSLSYQTQLNLSIVPLMILTTTLVYLIQLLQLLDFGNQRSTIFLYHVYAFDNLINSFFMYKSIYGKKSFNNFYNREFDLSFSQDSSCEPMVMPRFSSVFWVSLPGAHPVQVSTEILDRFDLWENVIENKERLKQIQKYQKRGMLSYLNQTFKNPDTFVEDLKNATEIVFSPAMHTIALDSRRRENFLVE